MNDTHDALPHVVIIGGGFGGLETAKALRDLPVRVTIVDRRNHHLFQPLLYQVAMAGLSPADIAIPIRSVLRTSERMRIVMGTVERVELDHRRVRLEDGEDIAYDYLVIAAGAQTNFFGNDRWDEHAFGLKSLEDAIEIRRRVLRCYEEAEREPDPEIRKRKLTFVLIGGGPTGVEVAGALAELGRRVLASDYWNIDASATRVVLVEAADRILTPFDPETSKDARAALEDLGVEVRTGSPVEDIDEHGVVIGDERIPAGAVIWSAGVEAVPLTKTLGVELDRAGRVKVDRDCSIPGHPEAFAIGDNALFLGADGAPLPGVSPVAMQQGRYAAKAIGERMAGLASEPFVYFDKGMMATIGRSRAVAEAKGLRMTGFLAWLAWLFVHLWYLVGFKNRVFVLLSWIVNYVAYRRGARLITEQVRPGQRAVPPRNTDNVPREALPTPPREGRSVP